jgi:hypothetical protein
MNHRAERLLRGVRKSFEKGFVQQVRPDQAVVEVYNQHSSAPAVLLWDDDDLWCISVEIGGEVHHAMRSSFNCATTRPALPRRRMERGKLCCRMLSPTDQIQRPPARRRGLA